MSFQKSFDDILNGILTDFQNIFPGVDVSQGSLARMKATAYASALWGLYNYQEWISRQIFPDTADTEALEHHVWVRGLTRTVGETDAELLTRLLDYIRRPPAGGNKSDYVKWALSIDNVAAAWCYPIARGDGTVDVVILADEATTGSEIPTEALRNEVLAYINTVRPVTHSQLLVLAPTIDVTNVTMTVQGSGVNLAQVADDITAYLDSREPNQPLYKAQLVAIAIQNGADNAVVTAPAADLVPVDYHMIRAGVVNVT